MQVLQKLSFAKAYKKLKGNQKAEVDNALKLIISDPLIGTQKKGDLSWVRVYKFTCQKQQALLAYEYNKDELILTFIALGSHENFYRDIKR